jgi:hypothetical protein
VIVGKSVSMSVGVSVSVSVGVMAFRIFRFIRSILIRLMAL